MSTDFPTGLDNFENPTGNESMAGKENGIEVHPAIKHSSQHADSNDAIEAIERKVGIDGSLDPRSLEARINAIVNSNPGAIADGDHGDITVSNSGFTWIIETGSVTDAKISNTAGIQLSKLATDPLARANHTGTQSADTIIDGTTNKVYTVADKTKLAGVAAGATVNQTDSYLLDRTNHTNTQLASTISDFVVTAQDAAGATLIGSPTLNLFYDTSINTIFGDVLDSPKLSGHPSTYYLDRTNHSGVQSADTIIDGVTNKVYTVTDRSKLSGIAPGATANSSDAFLLSRANHSGTQTAATISDFVEASQDVIGTILNDTSTVDLVYDDAANTIVANVLDSPKLQGSNAAFYLDRTNHTGSQAESTIINLVSDLAGKIPSTILTTKGDLLLGTGATPSYSKVGRGVDGQLLSTDSTQSSGVRWVDASGNTDAAAVHKTGDETITSGIKTFVVSPVVPTPITATAAANKGYIDPLIGAQPVSVLKYGSVINTADATAVIQAGLDDAKLIMLPPCAVGEQINVTSLKLRTGGGLLGHNSTVMMQKANATDHMISLLNNTQTDTIVAGFTIDQNNPNLTAWNGIFISNSGGGISEARHRVMNMKIRNFSGDGVGFGTQTRGTFCFNINTYFIDGYGLNNAGADSTFIGIECGQSGLAGIRAAAPNCNYLGGKLWLSGRVPATQATPDPVAVGLNPGLLIADSSQNFTGFNIQQNYGHGIQVFHSGADIYGITLTNCVVDSNNYPPGAGSYAACSLFRTYYSQFSYSITNSLASTPHSTALSIGTSDFNDFQITGATPNYSSTPTIGTLGANVRVVVNGQTIAGPIRSGTFVTKSVNYTLLTNELGALGTGGTTTPGITITLPITPIVGVPYTIKKTDISSNFPVFIKTSSGLIDGSSTSYSLTFQYQSISLIFDGTNWSVI